MFSVSAIQHHLKTQVRIVYWMSIGLIVIPPWSGDTVGAPQSTHQFEVLAIFIVQITHHDIFR